MGNPLINNINYRAGIMGNIYAQNLLQRQLQLQQLMAAQNILRIPPPTIRAPNARLILTPNMTQLSPTNNAIANPLMFQQMLAAQQQQLQQQQQQQQQQQTNTNTNNNQQQQPPPPQQPPS